MSAVGLEMGVSVLLGYGAGWWVDSKLDSGPWGGIIGIGFGFTAGVRSLWRLAQQIDREANAEQAAQTGSNDPVAAQAPEPTGEDDPN